MSLEDIKIDKGEAGGGSVTETFDKFGLCCILVSCSLFSYNFMIFHFKIISLVLIKILKKHKNTHN